MRFSHFVAGLTFAAVSAVVAGASAVPSDAHYARGATNIFWFMHVSDLHIGTCLASNWDARFRRVFAYSKVINPWFIVATGDLVEGAKTLCAPTTGQNQKEWDQYKAIYEEAKVTPDFFFDLPGNHDAYGDVGMTYYLKNSLQGRTNNSPIVTWTVDLPLGQYLFLGLNSVGNGSGAFFEKPEFIDAQMDQIRNVIKDNSKARLRIFAAHHHLTVKDDPPIGPLPVNADKVIDLMKSDGGSYYLHGHRHECGEYLLADGSIVVNQISTLGKGKVDNIGVVAIDHDAFTYRVTSTEDPWPLVTVTAPWGIDLRGEDYKHKLGDQSPEGRINPNAYTVCKDRKDNPVRALVFSEKKPTSVTATVLDAEPVAMTQSKVAPQIWEAEVDTTSLSAGLISIKVVAKVEGEKDGEHTIRVELVDGPCEKELPVDPDPGTGGAGGSGGSSDGGGGGFAGSGGNQPIGGAGGEDSSGGMGGGQSGAGGEAGEGEGGVAGTAGTGGIAGSAGHSTPRTDAGTDAGSLDLKGDSEGGGCSCEIGVSASNGASRTTGVGWIALLGMAAMAARRRKAQS